MKAAHRGIGVWDAMRDKWNADSTAAGNTLHFPSLEPYTPVEQVIHILFLISSRSEPFRLARGVSPISSAA
jgi:hypothetical protein